VRGSSEAREMLVGEAKVKSRVVGHSRRDGSPHVSSRKEDGKKGKVL